LRNAASCRLQVEAASHHVSDPIAAASLARGQVTGFGQGGVMTDSIGSGGGGAMLRGSARGLRLLWR